MQNRAKKHPSIRPTRNEDIPAARAAADETVKTAKAQAEERVNEAKGQTARLNELYAEYQKYPLITKQRMFYETMEEILPDMKVIIEKSDGTTQTMFPLESFTGAWSAKTQTKAGVTARKKAIRNHAGSGTALATPGQYRR